MRLRRVSGSLGHLILCTCFPGITHRLSIVCHVRRACLSGFRILLLGRRGIERSSKKLFSSHQGGNGNEERPGQETERADSLVQTPRPSLEDLSLLFEQFTLFYIVHDRHRSSRSLQSNSHLAAFTAERRSFGASGVRVV
ncbi:hypothetical protein [Bradyrhizobium sp. B117]|uniref:hypothetical protein n=1 Tax=Bradyrhizobium sp. B117 TaxID=3140246 RepID=UPI003183DCDD